MEINGGTSYQNIVTGSSINSAADNAASLAISEEMTSQINGYDQGADNAAYGQDLLNVAEGGLQNIQDALQRIRELSIQASNSAILSNDDLSAIQDEIKGFKETIQDAAKGTEYNTLKLLDGSLADVNLATNPSGNGMTIQLQNSTLEALGIADYDVTNGNFSIDAIDSALEKVSASRASIGSATNALEYAKNNSTYSSLNLEESRSELRDTDFAKEISEMKQKEILEQYKILVQKKQMEQEKQKLAPFI